MRISDWSSDVCSSDLAGEPHDDEDLALADVDVGGTHGTYQPGGLNLGQSRRACLLLQKTLRAGAEQLPHVAAGEFHGSLLHHGLRGSHLLGTGFTHLPGQLATLCMTAVVPGLVPTAFTHLMQRSEEHTSELQSLMRISYAVFCLNKKTNNTLTRQHHTKQN